MNGRKEGYTDTRGRRWWHGPWTGWRLCAGRPFLTPRRQPAQPRCGHADAVPVVSFGAVVAGLCPACNQQLPAGWFTCDHPGSRMVECDDEVIRDLDIGHSERMARHECGECGASWWQPTVIADWVRWI